MRLHGNPLTNAGGSAACGTVTPVTAMDDATAVKLYRKELLRLERTLPTHLLSPDWSDLEADWASSVQVNSLNSDRVSLSLSLKWDKPFGLT
jgi:hypothetical protein